MFKSPFSKKVRITTPFKKKGSWACGYHTGIDLVPIDGDKSPKLYAPCNCTILSVNSCGSSYGNHICAKTSNGYVFIMAHMKSIPLVKKGQKVKQGQQIGIMGNTGNSYGAHLHIEFEKADEWHYAKNLVNPTLVMDITKLAKPYTATKTIYKVVDANGGLNGYASLISIKSSVLIPNHTKVQLIKNNAGTKIVKGKKYIMSKIKYNNKTYYVASNYLK